MTEAEWMGCTDPTVMATFLHGEMSERKQRLFAVACCRRIWQLMRHDRSRAAVVCAELHADRPVDDLTLTDRILEALAALRESIEDGQSGIDEYACGAAAWSLGPLMGRSATQAVTAVGIAADGDSGAAAVTAEGRYQAGAFRDIFGNPFRSVAFGPTWRADTAVSLAKGMYETRDFTAMPILGDALQDAGCDDGDILNHCRGNGSHVRGCWVVDLVLGKE